MEKTNPMTGKPATESIGVKEMQKNKVNAPTPFDVKTQKQKLEAEKDFVTAIYFDGQKRISTYGGISYQTATLELIRLQNRDRKPITMIVLEEDKLPMGEVSWELADYEQYICKTKADEKQEDEETEMFLKRPKYDRCNKGHLLEWDKDRKVWDCPICIKEMQKLNSKESN